MARYYPGGHTILDRNGRFTSFDPAAPTPNDPAEKRKRAAARAKAKASGNSPYSLEELVKIAIEQNASGQDPIAPPKRCPSELRSQIAKYRSFHEWAKDQKCYMRFAAAALSKRSSGTMKGASKPALPGKQAKTHLVVLKAKRDELQKQLAAVEEQIKKLERQLQQPRRPPE